VRSHIIICGHSRAGTTLLHEIMRQSMPDWHFYEQERTFSRAEHDKVVTKRPLDVFKFEAIREYAKSNDVRVLLCIRDPRSILTSFHKSVPDDYFVDADYQYFVTRNRKTKTNPGLIAVHDAIMRMHNSELNTEIVRYEDTLKRPYTPGNTPPKMARALNGDRPIDASRLDAWRGHMDRLEDQFTRFPKLYDIMAEYGCDTDGFTFGR